LSFAAQGLISLLLAVRVFFHALFGGLPSTHSPEEDSEAYNIESRRLQIVEEVMTTGHDAQVITSKQSNTRLHNSDTGV
jgi:hypothetical protein